MFDMNNQDKIEELEQAQPVLTESNSTAQDKADKKPAYKTPCGCACKLKSAKLWVTIWAILMVTFIVLTNKSDFVLIAQLLCSVPLAYIGANVWQKQIFSRSVKE